MTDKTQTVCEGSAPTKYIVGVLNDRFRKGDKTVPGTFIITCGIDALLTQHDRSRPELAKIIQNYDSFDADSDPFREHDFGVFTFLGQKCFWKIDVYDKTLQQGAEDPTDLSNSKRVLTVMLAIEY